MFVVKTQIPESPRYAFQSQQGHLVAVRSRESASPFWAYSVVCEGGRKNWPHLQMQKNELGEESNLSKVTARERHWQD